MNKKSSVERNHSLEQLFWDKITRERMSEVGEDAPFDFMYRGEFIPESNIVRGVKLGDKGSIVEVDMVNVDLEDFYVRIYDVKLERSEHPLSPDFMDQYGSEISMMLEGTNNDWGYELVRNVFDSRRDYEETGDELVKGSVYWPGSMEKCSEDVYTDLETIFGQDFISQL